MAETQRYEVNRINWASDLIHWQVLVYHEKGPFILCNTRSFLCCQERVYLYFQHSFL